MKQIILLVANTENMCNLVHGYFTQVGYRVVTVANGNQALSIIPENRPDLIILDGIPLDRDGSEFMRQCQKVTDSPIIILTNGDANERIAGLEQGADDMIAKPCSMRELAARARAVLRRLGKTAPQAALPQIA